MPPVKPKARILETERVYELPFNRAFGLDLLKIEQDKHDGGVMQLKRLIFQRGHAVAILAIDPARDKVLLVNEMRPGMLAAGEYPFSDATAAGMIDAGESPLQAARREFLEETGVRLQFAKVVHKGAYVSPGGTSERIALVAGYFDSAKAGGVHGKAIEGESIRTKLYSTSKFLRDVNNGRIKDMKTLTLGFWLAQNKETLAARLPKKAKALKEKQKPSFRRGG